MIRVHEPTMFFGAIYQVQCPCGWASSVCEDQDAATDEFMAHSREEELLALAQVPDEES